MCLPWQLGLVKQEHDSDKELVLSLLDTMEACNRLV
jgi:hypothetical protein